MIKLSPVSIALLVLLPSLVQSALVITSPTTEWSEVSYGDNIYPDTFGDQQTGQADSDIVGTNGAPSFYTKFDDAGTTDLTDGTLAFRVRMADAAKLDWENTLFIGMDADNNGSIDLFAGLYKNNTVNLYYPGTGLNISPSTTTIKSSFYSTAVSDGVNYSFTAVDSTNAPGLPTDLDGVPVSAPVDYFVSFSIDFNEIVTGLASNNIAITEESAIMFLAATATQQNSLNQDLNGAPKISQANNDLTWQELGAASTPMTSTGDVVPEPYAISLIGFSGFIMLCCRRIHSRAGYKNMSIKGRTKKLSVK